MGTTDFFKMLLAKKILYFGVFFLSFWVYASPLKCFDRAQWVSTTSLFELKIKGDSYMLASWTFMYNYIGHFYVH